MAKKSESAKKPSIALAVEKAIASTAKTPVKRMAQTAPAVRPPAPLSGSRSIAAAAAAAKAPRPAANNGAAASAAKPKKPASAKPAASASAPAPIISLEDIRLRAYFIAEDRRRNHIHGDEQGDWIEAERQLRAELRTSQPAPVSAAKKPRTKKALPL